MIGYSIDRVWNGERSPVYGRKEYEDNAINEINSSRIHLLKDQHRIHASPVLTLIFLWLTLVNPGVSAGPSGYIKILDFRTRYTSLRRRHKYFKDFSRASAVSPSRHGTQTVPTSDKPKHQPHINHILGKIPEQYPYPYPCRSGNKQPRE